MYQWFRVFTNLQYLSPVFNETRPELVVAAVQESLIPFHSSGASGVLGTGHWKAGICR
jgi:hypothetical protein